MITFERPPLDYLILLKGGDNSKKKSTFSKNGWVDLALDVCLKQMLTDFIENKEEKWLNRRQEDDNEWHTGRETKFYFILFFIEQKNGERMKENKKKWTAASKQTCILSLTHSFVDNIGMKTGYIAHIKKFSSTLECCSLFAQ